MAEESFLQELKRFKTSLGNFLQENKNFRNFLSTQNRESNNGNGGKTDFLLERLQTLDSTLQRPWWELTSISAVLESSRDLPLGAGDGGDSVSKTEDPSTTHNDSEDFLTTTTEPEVVYVKDDLDLNLISENSDEDTNSTIMANNEDEAEKQVYYTTSLVGRRNNVTRVNNTPSTSNSSSTSNNGKIPQYKCRECGMPFFHSSSLSRHIRFRHNTNKNSRFPCPHCVANYRRKDTLNRHIRVAHPKNKAA